MPPKTNVLPPPHLWSVGALARQTLLRNRMTFESSMAISPDHLSVFWQTPVQGVCWKSSVRSAGVSYRMLRLMGGSVTVAGKLSKAVALVAVAEIPSRHDGWMEMNKPMDTLEARCRCVDHFNYFFKWTLLAVPFDPWQALRSTGYSQKHKLLRHHLFFLPWHNPRSHHNVALQNRR